MLVGTLTNILVKKFLGRKFIPRFAKYLIKFPDYNVSATFSECKSCSHFNCKNFYEEGPRNKPLIIGHSGGRTGARDGLSVSMQGYAG